MANCLFSGCSEPGINATDSRVEVKTVLPSHSEMEHLKSKLQIQWKRNGEAMFHQKCWNDLIKSARSKKIQPHLPILEPGEKILLRQAAKTAEFFDSYESLRENAAKCASLIKSTKHCTAFTGAGISTSAGIGDYRGKSGKWTQQDHDAVNMDGLFGETKDEPNKDSKVKKTDNEEENEEDGIAYESLRPTYTHEALKKLIDMGYLKYIISQNCDGLHGLSGVPCDRLSELHGNVYVELCEKCGTRYVRSYYALDDIVSQYYGDIAETGTSFITKPPYAKKCQTCGLSHRTGRKCDIKECKGALMDSIINFGDKLEEDILSRAEDHARQSDLMLCLGSTLSVTPANCLVEMTREPHNLAICNRQTTYMDGHCGQGVRVFGDCDMFMKEVMRGILEPEELLKWEGEREKRMQHYMTLRQVKH